MATLEERPVWPDPMKFCIPTNISSTTFLGLPFSQGDRHASSMASNIPLLKVSGQPPQGLLRNIRRPRAIGGSLLTDRCCHVAIPSTDGVGNFEGLGLVDSSRGGRFLLS